MQLLFSNKENDQTRGCIDELRDHELLSLFNFFKV